MTIWLIWKIGKRIDKAMKPIIDPMNRIIKGSISADVLVVLKTARIEGDVTYGSLTIEEGAQVDGKFTPRALDAEPKLMLAGGTEAN